MLDGLWTLEYEGSAYLAGGGVVIVNGKQILGGDSWYYFQGTVQENGTDVSATVVVKAFISSAVTVFGVSQREFTISLFGQVGDNIIRGKAKTACHDNCH